MRLEKSSSWLPTSHAQTWAVLSVSLFLGMARLPSRRFMIHQFCISINLYIQEARNLLWDNTSETYYRTTKLRRKHLSPWFETRTSTVTFSRVNQQKNLICQAWICIRWLVTSAKGGKLESSFSCFAFILGVRTWSVQETNDNAVRVSFYPSAMDPSPTLLDELSCRECDEEHLLEQLSAMVTPFLGDKHLFPFLASANLPCQTISSFIMSCSRVKQRYKELLMMVDFRLKATQKSRPTVS